MFFSVFFGTRSAKTLDFSKVGAYRLATYALFINNFMCLHKKGTGLPGNDRFASGPHYPHVKDLPGGPTSLKLLLLLLLRFLLLYVSWCSCTSCKRTKSSHSCPFLGEGPGCREAALWALGCGTWGELSSYPSYCLPKGARAMTRSVLGRAELG